MTQLDTTTTVTRPIRLEDVPRCGQGLGAARLILAVWPLITQFEVLFLVLVLKELQRGNRRRISQRQLEELLQKADLGPQARSLSQWFQLPVMKPREVPDTAADLHDVARSLEDIASEDGRWTVQTEQDAADAEEAFAAFETRLRQLIRSVERRQGPGAAIAVLKTIRVLIEEAKSQTERQWESAWTTTRSQELLELAARVKAMATPKSFKWRVLLRLSSRLSPRRWLTRAQIGVLRRQVLPALDEATRKRFQAALESTRRDVYRRLLGTAEEPGLFDQLAQELLSSRRVFQELIELYHDQIPQVSSSTSAIQLIESFHTVINQDTGQTYGDLCLKRAQAAGATPIAFADQLRREGLSVSGRTFKPHEWKDAPTLPLLKQLRGRIKAYLGSDDPYRPLRQRNPRTAVEQIAQVHLGSLELRWLLGRKITELVRASRPYIRFEPVGGRPHVYAYLFCDPAIRQTLKDQLMLHVPLVDDPRPDAAKRFGLPHPFQVVVGQYLLGGAPGALPEYRQAIHQLKRLRAEGKLTPLFTDRPFLETRLLSRRPDDLGDAETLLKAAQKAHVVAAVCESPRQLVPTRLTAGIQLLFAPEVRMALPRTAEEFGKKLSDPQFSSLIARQHPELTDWPLRSRQLIQRDDAIACITALKNLGIVESAREGFWRLARVPQTGEIPMGLIAKRPGSIQGLTEDAFLTALMDDDTLYNHIFWNVATALADGRLSEADVTPFLLEQVSITR